MKHQYPHQLLFGLPFFSGTVKDAVRLIASHLDLEKNLLTIATPNPEQIVQMHEDHLFAQHLSQFDLFLPDGVGIVWASQRQNTPLIGRITGVDVVRELLGVAREKKLTVMVVGGEGYTSAQLTVHSERYQLRPVGTVSQDERSRTQGTIFPIWWTEGYQDIGTLDHARLEQADQHVLAAITKVKPDIIFVALGAPHQEAWIIRHHKELERSGVRVAMVVGGAFDFLTGKVVRAAAWVQYIHLEWLFRLLQQPWRWRRQLRLVRFVRMVMEGQERPRE